MILQPTPNLQLQPIDANRRVWADVMNNNLRLIDATVGTYFVIQNLQGPWQNSTDYEVGQSVIDTDSSVVYMSEIAHRSANLPTTFEEDRAANPTYWTVYSTPARARGVWEPDTTYALNDFVSDNGRYAIAIETHTSSDSFDSDLAAEKWSVLIDLSTYGSSVIPTPDGAADADKFVVVNSVGTGYILVSSAATLELLGVTATGEALMTAATASAARTAINAQVAGSYQPLATSLTTLAGFTIGAFADDLLVCSSAATVRTALGLSSLATLTPAANVSSFLISATSENLRQALTDETGGGNAVFSASPTFTGIPLAPTAAQFDDSTQIATTAYADRAGRVKQIVKKSITGYDSTAGTGIPLDNTIPTSSEGDEIETIAIAPKSATSTLFFDANIMIARANTDSIIMALFEDNETSAIAVVVTPCVANIPTMVRLLVPLASGSTSARTYKIHVGSATAATLYINGNSSNELFNGLAKSEIVITEYE